MLLIITEFPFLKSNPNLSNTFNKPCKLLWKFSCLKLAAIDSFSFIAWFGGAVRWVVVLGKCIFVWLVLFNKKESSSGEREVTFCTGSWVEKAPDWVDLGKGRWWPKGHG